MRTIFILAAHYTEEGTYDRPEQTAYSSYEQAQAAADKLNAMYPDDGKVTVLVFSAFLREIA